MLDGHGVGMVRVPMLLSGKTCCDVLLSPSRPLYLYTLPRPETIWGSWQCLGGAGGLEEGFCTLYTEWRPPHEPINQHASALPPLPNPGYKEAPKARLARAPIPHALPRILIPGSSLSNIARLERQFPLPPPPNATSSPGPRAWGVRGRHQRHCHSLALLQFNSHAALHVAKAAR